MNQIETAYFKVAGMYCITCKAIIEKQLEGEKGIKKIGVDHMTDSVAVDYDSALINKKEIKERLEKPGYRFLRNGSLNYRMLHWSWLLYIKRNVPIIYAYFLE